MSIKVHIRGRRITLKQSQLIQSGGEGMVFDLGQTAVKLYHKPRSYHRDKLKDWIASGLSMRLPAEILGPESLVLDDRGRIIGFQMERLPLLARPIKRLSSPAAWQKHQFDVADLGRLFLALHKTLNLLHRQGVVVGDLNDRNIFYETPAGKSQQSAWHSYWIDADSYQFDSHPCPVAMLAFLDPTLFGVADLSRRPIFSPMSDWYAFFTLFIKSLLLVHPYGGVHNRYKSLASRATAGISILNPAVIYPQQARPVEMLSDELLHHIHLVYEKERRMKVPERLLTQFNQSLVRCSNCGLSFPSERGHCPACRRQVSLPRRVRAASRLAKKMLWQEDGFIEHVHVLPDGRILVVVRAGGGFKLVRAGAGGKLDETPLFDGRSAYRFRFFSRPGEGTFLAVNPGYNPQLLLFDVTGSQPEKVILLETATFLGQAVFAATARHLLRIAGRWILRGSVRDGHYVEDMIATAHKAQTRFWASANNGVVAGFHRIFAEHRYFLIGPDLTCHELPLPALAPGESLRETAVAFGPQSVAFRLHIGCGGQSRMDTHIADLSGRLRYSYSETADIDADARLYHYPYATRPGLPAPHFVQLPHSLDIDGSDVLHIHPAGILVQGSNSLSLVTGIGT